VLQLFRRINLTHLSRCTNLTHLSSDPSTSQWTDYLRRLTYKRLSLIWCLMWESKATETETEAEAEAEAEAELFLRPQWTDEPASVWISCWIDFTFICCMKLEQNNYATRSCTRSGAHGAEQPPAAQHQNLRTHVCVTHNSDRQTCTRTDSCYAWITICT